MAGRPSSKPAPPFGQRLAAARQAKGLSQLQLAQLLNTTQKTIDYYERRSLNPTLDFIERAAHVLNLAPSQLLPDLANPPASAPRLKPGPISQLQLRFDLVKQLPRNEQDFILKFLDTILLRYHLLP